MDLTARWWGREQHDSAYNASQWFMPTRHISMSDVLRIQQLMEKTGGTVRVFRTSWQMDSESRYPEIADLVNCPKPDRSAIGMTLQYPGTKFPALQVQVGSRVAPEIGTRVHSLQDWEELQRGEYSREVLEVLHLRDTIWRLIVSDNRRPLITVPMLMDVLRVVLILCAAALLVWFWVAGAALPAVLIAAVALTTAVVSSWRAIKSWQGNRQYAVGRIWVRYPTRDVWRAERAKRSQLILTGVGSAVGGVIVGVVLGVLGFG